MTPSCPLASPLPPSNHPPPHTHTHILCPRPLDPAAQNPRTGAFRWINSPQSVLINGRGSYMDCGLLFGGTFISLRVLRLTCWATACQRAGPQWPRCEPRCEPLCIMLWLIVCGHPLFRSLEITKRALLSAPATFHSSPPPHLPSTTPMSLSKRRKL
jgi:hypothetical protein